MSRAKLLAFLTAAFLFAITGSAFATDRYASPSGSGSTCSSGTPCSLATAVSQSAASGDRVLLKSGTYSTFTGGSKTSLTITKDTGATPTLDFSFDGSDTGLILDNLTIAGGDLTCSGCTTPNLTFQNDSFTSNVVINGPHNNSNHAATLFTNDHFDAAINCTSGPNAKIHFSYGSTGNHSGVTISNSTFFNGACDGVHTGIGVDVLNNEFKDICETGTNHTDNIQFEGATGGRIANNWIHVGSGCTTQGITSFDGGTDGVTIEDNVIDIRRPWDIEFYADKNSVIRHNTLIYHSDANCDFTGIQCGWISVTHKVGDPVSDGTQVYNNLAFDVDMSDTTNGREDHNVNPQTAVFVGGASPTTWAGFALDCSSPVGLGAADDGSNDGAITGSEVACPFVNDTFTGSGGTTLASHTGETGATWTQHSGWTGTMGITSSPGNTVRNTLAGAFSLYYASGTPPSANYSAEVDCLAKTLTGQCGVALRLDTSATTFYFCRYYVSAGQWQLLKFVNGTATTLNTSNATLSTNTNYHVKGTANGSAITCTSNGSTVASATDSAITATGKAGLGLGAGSTVSDSVGWQADNFSATGV